MPDSLRVLMIGDVVGEKGMQAVEGLLGLLVQETAAHFVVVNAENAVDGFGIKKDTVDRLRALGVAAVTSGNHLWQHKEIRAYLGVGDPAGAAEFNDSTLVDSDHNEKENKARPGSVLIRPSNYPPGVPGVGSCVVSDNEGRQLGVVNVQGRVRLSNIDCPFRAASRELETIPSEVKAIVVDFHAEDTEEKEAMAHYLDGNVSAVVGTHTHVQTADARVSTKGTASITDLGMTGPKDSVIGFIPGVARERMVSQMPLKMQVSENEAAVRGALVEIDSATGRCRRMEAVERFPI